MMQLSQIKLQAKMGLLLIILHAILQLSPIKLQAIIGLSSIAPLQAMLQLSAIKLQIMIRLSPIILASHVAIVTHKLQARMGLLPQ